MPKVPSAKNTVNFLDDVVLGGGFTYLFIFTPTWGNDPI